MNVKEIRKLILPSFSAYFINKSLVKCELNKNRNKHTGMG